MKWPKSYFCCHGYTTSYNYCNWYIHLFIYVNGFYTSSFDGSKCSAFWKFWRAYTKKRLEWKQSFYNIDFIRGLTESYSTLCGIYYTAAITDSKDLFIDTHQNPTFYRGYLFSMDGGNSYFFSLHFLMFWAQWYIREWLILFCSLKKAVVIMYALHVHWLHLETTTLLGFVLAVETMQQESYTQKGGHDWPFSSSNISWL